MSLPMPRTELIALIAAMFACVAFSMDSMLPALPQMGAALSPDDPNAVGMVLDESTDLDELAELLTDSYCVQAPAALAEQVPRPGPETP